MDWHDPYRLDLDHSHVLVFLLSIHEGTTSPKETNICRSALVQRENAEDRVEIEFEYCDRDYFEKEK